MCMITLLSHRNTMPSRGEKRKMILIHVLIAAMFAFANANANAVMGPNPRERMFTQAEGIADRSAYQDVPVLDEGSIDLGLHSRRLRRKMPKAGKWKTHFRSCDRWKSSKSWKCSR